MSPAGDDERVLVVVPVRSPELTAGTCRVLLRIVRDVADAQDEESMIGTDEGREAA